jgi:hypothetical protein
MQQDKDVKAKLKTWDRPQLVVLGTARNLTRTGAIGGLSDGTNASTATVAAS